MLKEVFDGVAWTKGEVKVGERGYRKLLGCADCRRMRIAPTFGRTLGNRRLEVDYVGEPNAERISADQRGGAR